MQSSKYSGKKATGIDQEIRLGAKVEGTETLLEQVAETQHGDELDYRLNRGHDSRGSHYARQTDYDWTRSTEVGPDRRFGETLAQQERRHGREAEQARHRETALDAHNAGIDRAASSRELTTTGQAQRRRDFWERKHLAAGRQTVTVPAGNHSRTVDPRQSLDRDTLAEINSQAHRIAQRFDVSRAGIARRLAEEFDKQGVDIAGAVLTVLDGLRDDIGVPTPIDDIDPEGESVTVEGRITTLFDPASPNQYQVGYLGDDAGDRVKVTVWVRSTHGPMIRTLREGDRVRIVDGKPGQFAGTKTVAVTSETCLCVLEQGDGSAPTGECRVAMGCAGSHVRMAAWRADAPTHQWANVRNAIGES
ncbi:hypothetical protein [Halomicrobium salinisoli]|uniref:hypothetical protein n=1 Tax=Halomicrobium salinisoli TaxID=2878391 RepID=UPI001CEFD5C8|nr:hypothetical protein [Halomicrobium salinisoli]